ncbi:MAG: hypothetical protein IT348_06895, partial [Candidatus Eisenbacteria bacterium]|nr:hypothetical protein [Candidatus Eisenbacteria bacterium]
MTDDRQPPTEPIPPEHEHHGVVETLREELHEVVEHVPQPVRWTVGKLVRIGLFTLVGLIVLAIVSAALYLANRTELVAQELAILLNHTLSQRSDLVLEVPDIKGNPFTGFRVVEPRVRFRDGPVLLEARSLRVGYSAWALLRGGTHPVDVTIDRPVVRLDHGAGGTWRLPKLEPGPKPAKSGNKGVNFRVHIRDAQLSVPRPLGRVEGVEILLSGRTGPATRVDLQRMRWKSGPWHSRLEALSGEFRSDADSVRFRVREMRTGDFALSAMGGWRQGSTIRVVRANVKRVRWQWLAEVFDNKTFAVPGEASARVEASGAGRWQGQVEAEGSWDSLAATGRGRFQWDGKSLVLDSLVARSLAGNLRGGVRWSREGWEIGGQAEHADPAHWHALHLDHWPAGNMNGEFRYVVDSKPRQKSTLTARLVESQWV